MAKGHFPERIRALPPFEGPFDAFRLQARRCEVLFASYPAGTEIDAHSHPTENCGCITQGELILITDGRERRYACGEWYYLRPGERHAARFEVATSEIEFWFEAEVPMSEIQHEPSQARFVLALEQGEAVLDYVQADDQTLDYRRTFVPQSLRGQGIATHLVRHALDYARAQGLRVIPSCPFVAQVIDRYPEEYGSLTARR